MLTLTLVVNSCQHHPNNYYSVAKSVGGKVERGWIRQNASKGTGRPSQSFLSIQNTFIQCEKIIEKFNGQPLTDPNDPAKMTVSYLTSPIPNI